MFTTIKTKKPWRDADQNKDRHSELSLSIFKILPETCINVPSFPLCNICWITSNYFIHLQLWDIFQNLTFVRNIGPLRIGELVLAHPDPLFHAGGDGLTRVRVERREPAQATDGKQRIVVRECNWNVPFRLIHIQMDAILTEYTWLHPETTCHMTYHTSLAQEPLGLNEQGNTEEWRVKHTPESKLDKMLTERDIVGGWWWDTGRVRFQHGL